MQKEKILDVQDLTVSFRTDNGLVQAVRGVSFDLSKGETLCIVGESGSGKSVTSKAIMGLLANNAIVEKGSIIYEGENLLEVSEEEFHRIRGHKIGMIFQDPLSSLNPIVKIGKQITEAMLINSNKLKLMFNDIIASDLTAFNNAISRKNNHIKKELAHYRSIAEKNSALLKAKDLSEELKLEYKKEIQNAREACVANCAKIKEQTKKDLVPLKEALAKKKIIAKKRVSDYKNQVNQTFKEKYAALKQKYASLDKDSSDIEKVKEEIKQAKLERINSLKITRREAKKRALEVMKEVGIPLPEKRLKQYPFEFSGGMRQRIVIAIALTATPEVLICDEPTTALDVTIQAQILELIKKIQAERNIACIFITHDLGVVANMADRVAVMYAGKIVEYGDVDEIFFNPQHPYTWALLASIPDVDSKERLVAIPGTPPNMIYPPKGDAFALRSSYAMKIDFEHQPPFFKVSDTHYAATWLLHPDAPKVEMPKIVSERIKIALSAAKALEKDATPVQETPKKRVSKNGSTKPKKTSKEDSTLVKEEPSNEQ